MKWDAMASAVFEADQTSARLLSIGEAGAFITGILCAAGFGTLCFLLLTILYPVGDPSFIFGVCGFFPSSLSGFGTLVMLAKLTAKLKNTDGASASVMAAARRYPSAVVYDEDFQAVDVVATTPSQSRDKLRVDLMDEEEMAAHDRFMRFIDM